MNCPNCGHDSEGMYCPVCSQRMVVKRISFKEGWLDFWGRIYGFDSMLPRTLRDLTVRPGIVAKRYIEGNRVLYYGPVGYFFLMVTLTFVLASMVGVDMYELLGTRASEITGTTPGRGVEEVRRRMLVVVVDNLKWLNFGMIVLQTLWLRLFFRKSGYNLLEHSILVFFVMGHMYWLRILEITTAAITGRHFHPAVTMSVAVLFFAYAAMSLYSHQHRVDKAEAFVKGLLVYIVALACFALIIGTLAVVIIVSDPEMLELMRPGNNK